MAERAPVDVVGGTGEIVGNESCWFEVGHHVDGRYRRVCKVAVFCDVLKADLVAVAAGCTCRKCLTVVAVGRDLL